MPSRSGAPRSRSMKLSSVPDALFGLCIFAMRSLTSSVVLQLRFADQRVRDWVEVRGGEGDVYPAEMLKNGILSIIAKYEEVRGTGAKPEDINLAVLLRGVTRTDGLRDKVKELLLKE